jgi:hypothetical protein
LLRVKNGIPELVTVPEPGASALTHAIILKDSSRLAFVEIDGRLEILLPKQGLTELGAVRRTPTGAEAAWSVPLGGKLRTNLAAVTLSNGTLAIGAGREDKVLRIWLPE